jgi:hypothetical protein
MKKSKRSKSATAPSDSRQGDAGATPPATPPSPPSPEPHASQDVTELLQRAATELPVWGPWKNKRELAICEVCQEEHQHPLSYAARILRRGGDPTSDEAQWLVAHLSGHDATR